MELMSIGKDVPYTLISAVSWFSQNQDPRLKLEPTEPWTSMDQMVSMFTLESTVSLLSRQMEASWAAATAKNNNQLVIEREPNLKMKLPLKDQVL